MHRLPHVLQLGTTLALASLIAACGSDGDNASASSANTLSGTVAVGAPVSGATINAKCIVGNYSATSNASGTYGLVIPAGNFPCAVRSSGGSANGNSAPTLHSFARNAGTANVTPLTDLALALQVNASASQSITDWFANPSNLSAISTALADAADDLRDALIAAGYTVPATWTAGSTTPFSSTFTPNPVSDAYDQLLEDIAEAIENSATLADYNALVAAFVAGNALPEAPEEEEPPITPPVTPGTPLAAVQAVAGNYIFNVEAIRTEIGDFGITSRGLRGDAGFPACAAIGITATDTRWSGRVVIGSNGSVSLQNADDASQAITLTPGSISSDDNTSISAAQYSSAWNLANPGSKSYDIKRAIRYNDGVHSGMLTEYFSFTLGITSSGQLGHVQLTGQSTSPRMTFCSVSGMQPKPSDILAPLKALAGSYELKHDYVKDASNWVAPGWSNVVIGSNGSVTFAGTAPSFSPAEVTDLKISRRNDSNYGPDNSVWALSARLNRDINGDGVTNQRDSVHFFLGSDGSLRDIQYKDSATHLVEVSVQERQLPAYDDTLASNLSGNGVIAKINGEARSIIHTETHFRTEVANAGRLDLYVGRNKFPDVPTAERRAWRITVNTTNLALNTPFACTNGDIGSVWQGTAVLFDNTYGKLTSANSGGAVQPSHSSRAGGDCEITLSSVSKNGSGILTGVEGKFRATLWVADENRYEPAVGFFRYSLAP